MPDETAITANAPEVSREEPRAKRAITCGFCDCKLTPSGDYLELSDKAREMRDAKETIRELERAKAAIQTELDALKEHRMAHPEASSGETPKRKSIFRR